MHNTHWRKSQLQNCRIAQMHNCTNSPMHNAHWKKHTEEKHNANPTQNVWAVLQFSSPPRLAGGAESRERTIIFLRYALKKNYGIIWEFFPYRGEGLPNSQNFCKLTKYFFVCQIHSEVLKHVLQRGGGDIWSILSPKVHLISFISGKKNGVLGIWEVGEGGPLFPKVNVKIMAKF